MYCRRPPLETQTGKREPKTHFKAIFRYASRTLSGDAVLSTPSKPHGHLPASERISETASFAATKRPTSRALANLEIFSRVRPVLFPPYC